MYAHSKTHCMCRHRPYLLDLALLGSQVAPRLLEVPEMTVMISTKSIHKLHYYSLFSQWTATGFFKLHHTYHITSWRCRRVRGLQKHRGKSWEKWCNSQTFCWVSLFEHLPNWSWEDLARVYPHQVPWKTHTQTHTLVFCFLASVVISN